MNYELHNKYDAFTKVKNVIESCKTNEQLKVATVMSDNFELYYKENDKYLLNTLNNVRYKKLCELVENALTGTKLIDNENHSKDDDGYDLFVPIKEK